MSAFLTASLVLALLVFSFSVSAGQRIITAEPGDNVILTCRAAENKDVIVVEWNRTDLESDHYVLRYRDKKFDPEHQSLSFINRVSLLDVKNRDVSLVLKNVTTDDTRTYECRVVQRGNNHRKRSFLDTESISTINLRVEAAKQCGEAANQGNTSRKRRSVDTDHNCNNPDQRIITAEPGDNVILTCRAAEKKDVRVVKWSRTDLKSGQFVLQYKNNQSDPKLQSPSFKNRVDLLDVKNGDVSLVLKDVTTDDTGRYECQVDYERNNRRKRAAGKPISTINLRVGSGINIGLIVGLSVFAVAVVGGGVAAVLYKRSRDSSRKSKRPPAAAAEAEKTLTGPDE